jgi:hypothetical protein
MKFIATLVAEVLPIPETKRLKVPISLTAPALFNVIG